LLFYLVFLKFTTVISIIVNNNLRIKRAVYITDFLKNIKQLNSIEFNNFQFLYKNNPVWIESSGHSYFLILSSKSGRSKSRA